MSWNSPCFLPEPNNPFSSHSSCLAVTQEVMQAEVNQSLEEQVRRSVPGMDKDSSTRTSECGTPCQCLDSL